MTTIAYKDGILAADSRAYAGDKLPIGHKKKIRKFADGSMAGASTVQVGLSEKILDWIAAGCDPSAFPHNDQEKGYFILMVDKDGKVFFSNSLPYFTGPLEADFWAIGSGELYAVGAMAAGASAEEAVRIAARYDQWTAEPITTLTQW